MFEKCRIANFDVDIDIDHDVHVDCWCSYFTLINFINACVCFAFGKSNGRDQSGPKLLKLNVWNDHIFLALKVYSGVGIDIRQRVLLKDVKEKV